MELKSFLIRSDYEMSDPECYHKLRVLLDLRARAASGQWLSLWQADEAATWSESLNRSLLGWILVRLNLDVMPEQITDLSANRVRDVIAGTLRCGLPILQQELRTELSQALEALNAGNVYPLLERNPGRRRKEPDSSAKAEFEILQWIRWQHGRGSKVKDAQAEAAAAVGCTKETLAKWRVELEKVYDKAVIRSRLQIAEKIGRHERAGKSLKHIDPSASDENYALWAGIFILERDITILAARRQRSIAKREKPSPKGTKGT